MRRGQPTPSMAGRRCAAREEQRANAASVLAGETCGRLGRWGNRKRGRQPRSKESEGAAHGGFFLLSVSGGVGQVLGDLARLREVEVQGGACAAAGAHD